MKIKVRLCVNGVCDVCGRSTLNEEGEPKEGSITALRTLANHDDVVGEWCSEGCFEKAVK